MRMLLDYYETDRILICLDPSNFDLLEDFYADRNETRLLEIECDYSDSYLEGHAIRVGLAGPQTSEDTFRRLLPAVRNDVHRESERIRDQNFPEFYRLRERNGPEENARALSGFLRLDRDKALDVASTPYLFDD